MLSEAVDWEGACVCLLALGVFMNTLGHGFVYDDNRAILSNPDIQASSSLVNVFHNDFWGTPLSSSNSHGSYRPLCVLSYRLNHWACGFQPVSFHLTNIVLHVTVTALVLKTARVLVPGKSAFLAASLFAVHPIHVEAVAGIVGRADLLAAIFYLVSFLSYVNHVKRRDDISSSKMAVFQKQISSKTKTTHKKSGLISKTTKTHLSFITFNLNQFHTKYINKLTILPPETFYFSLYLVFAVCSVLSKEPGLTVIPLAICYDIILHLRSKRHSKLKCFIASSASASLLSFLAILMFRLYLMGLQTPNFSKADNPTAKEGSFFTRTLTFFYLPVFNFILLAFPRWLSFDWSMDAIPRVHSMFDPRFTLTFLFYFFIYRMTVSAVGSTKIQRSKSNTKLIPCKICNNHLGFEHLASCKIINNNNLPQHCCCSNASNKPLSRGSAVTMCLAFIVLPFIPASNLFFYVGFVVAERVLYLSSVGFCLLVALGMRVLWDRNRSLAFGGCLLLLVTFGARTIQRNKDWQSEESLYRSAVHINPPKAFGNLGSVLSTAGRLEEAEAALRVALENRPNMADVHYNLGNLLSRQQKYQEAVASYQLAIQYRPSLAVAYLNLGQVLEIMNRLHEAEVEYHKCWRLDVEGLKDPRSHEEARLSCLHQLTRVCKRRSCQAESEKTVLSVNKDVNGSFKGVPAVSSDSSYVELARNTTSRDSSGFSKDSRNITKTARSQQMCLRAKLKSPQDPKVYVNHAVNDAGQLLVREGRHREAATLYVKAAQLAPHQHTLVTSAAIALRHAGRLAEAEALYRKARDLRPEDAASHSNLGAILHTQGKYSQAARCYKEALRLAPKDHETLANLQKLRNLLARHNNR